MTITGNSSLERKHRPPPIDTQMLAQKKDLPEFSPIKPQDTPTTKGAKTKLQQAKAMMTWDGTSLSETQARQAYRRLVNPPVHNEIPNRHVFTAMGQSHQWMYQVRECGPANPAKHEFSTMYRKDWYEDGACYWVSPCDFRINAPDLPLKSKIPQLADNAPHYCFINNPEGLAKPPVAAHGAAAALYLDSRSREKNYRTETYYTSGREYVRVPPAKWEIDKLVQHDGTRFPSPPTTPTGQHVINPYPKENPFQHFADRPESPTSVAAREKYREAVELQAIYQNPNSTEAEKHRLYSKWPLVHSESREPDPLMKRVLTITNARVFEAQAEDARMNPNLGEHGIGLEQSGDAIPTLRIAHEKFEGGDSVVASWSGSEHASVETHSHTKVACPGPQDHAVAPRLYLNNYTRSAVMTGRNNIEIHPTKWKTIRLGKPGTAPARDPSNKYCELNPWRKNRFENYDGMGGIENSKSGKGVRPPWKI